MKKIKLALLIALTLLVTSATFAYATIQYNLSTSTEHSVGVGIQDNGNMYVEFIKKDGN